MSDSIYVWTMTRTRRRFLAGTAGAVALAGCVGSGQSDEGEDGSGDGQETLQSHPAATALDEQPRLGPPPSEARGTIIAFEDPSCPLCGEFEQETVPQIRRELVEPGDAAFVFRGYPLRYDWGEPALRALEATYARDADAHWTLADHYFGNQDEFRSAGPDAVLPRTREFLADNTAVDADAVVDAAESGEADTAVQTDADAGEAAGATATPAVYLFRDGEYRTMFTSSIGFDAIESTLQL